MRTSTAYFAGVGTVIAAVAAGLGGGYLAANIAHPPVQAVSKLERRMSAEPIHVATAPAEPVSRVAATNAASAPAQEQPQPQTEAAAPSGNAAPSTNNVRAEEKAASEQKTATNVAAARPDVFNHNLETVPRLYPTIRPGARYFTSLNLLSRVKEQEPGIFTKSGIMVGLGETKEEVMQVMDDLRAADVDFLTIGQYLQPTPKHAKVMEFVTPAAFGAYAAIARAKGFLQVASSPLTRSSYHAGKDFAEMRAAREAHLARAAR